MKTYIIILIIFCVLYGFGAFNEKPADKIQPIRRNRSEEDRKTLQVFWDAADQYMDIPELEPEATDLMRRVESSLKFGFSAKDVTEYRSIVKDLYKRAATIQDEISTNQ